MEENFQVLLSACRTWRVAAPMRLVGGEFKQPAEDLAGDRAVDAEIVEMRANGIRRRREAEPQICS